MDAEGLTPEQLHGLLLDRYKTKITDPEINLVVRSSDSNRVYVGGEVKSPGSIPIAGRMTVLEAIMQAGGFLKESAKPSTTVVVRQQDGKQVAMTLDLSKPIEEATSDPFYVQPHDIIVVPRTAIDQLESVGRPVRQQARSAELPV